MFDVAVIGGGLFGQITAAVLRRAGCSVVVFDCREQHTASFAAGCVMRPSWASRMSSQQVDDALTLLEETFGLREVTFRLRPTNKRLKLWNLDPRLPLDSAVTNHRVTDLVEDHQSVIIPGTGVTARYAVVAAGVWTELLCPWVKQQGKWGCAFRGPAIAEPFIQLWAPYKQIVALTLADGRGWVGDGTALTGGVSEEREQTSRARCEHAVGGRWRSQSVITGVRPYIRMLQPCYFERRGRVIVATGGAKNGTLAAAWAAARVKEIVGG